MADVREAVLEARAAGGAIAIAGGRHAMGGQQFASNAALIDTRPLNQVLHFDRTAGTVEVEAGIQWPELVRYLVEVQEGQTQQWGIAQKQTGADRLTTIQFEPNQYSTEFAFWDEKVDFNFVYSYARSYLIVERAYAATNPSEFFAVATETFFGQPVALHAAKPALYGVLSGFYRQDPASRVGESAPEGL